MISKSVSLYKLKMKNMVCFWPQFKRVASSIFLDEFSPFSLGFCLAALIMLQQMISVHFIFICFLFYEANL